MELLIRAARAGDVIGDDMAKKLQQLRRLRNRVHIKTIEELEYFAYTHFLTNSCINTLEEFRLVAKEWFEASRRGPLPMRSPTSHRPHPPLTQTTIAGTRTFGSRTARAGHLVFGPSVRRTGRSVLGRSSPASLGPPGTI